MKFMYSVMVLQFLFLLTLTAEEETPLGDDKSDTTYESNSDSSGSDTVAIDDSIKEKPGN